MTLRGLSRISIFIPNNALNEVMVKGPVNDVLSTVYLHFKHHSINAANI